MNIDEQIGRTQTHNLIMKRYRNNWPSQTSWYRGGLKSARNKLRGTLVVASIFRNTNRNTYCLERIAFLLRNGNRVTDEARKNQRAKPWHVANAKPRHATPVTRRFRFHNRRLVVTGAKWHGSGSSGSPRRRGRGTRGGSGCLRAPMR